MTRHYFSDPKNVHTHPHSHSHHYPQSDDSQTVNHQKTSEKRIPLVEKYEAKLLAKADAILSNRKLLTYMGSALALGLLLGTAGTLVFKMRRKRSAANFLNKLFNSRF